MDTQKLHDLIDKVIGKDGPLRTPAYWMRRVLNGIISKAEDDIAALGAEVATKLNKATPLTYLEFYRKHHEGKCVEGAYYHITDYTPTLSVRQEGFSKREYRDASLYIKYTRDLREEGDDYGNRYHRDYTIFEGCLIWRDYGVILNVLYEMHDRYVNGRYLDWMPQAVEALDTIEAVGEDGNTYSLKYLSSAAPDMSVSLYYDKDRDKTYELHGVRLNRNRKIGDVRIVTENGVVDCDIIDYTFRVFGNIVKVENREHNTSVCYDYTGLYADGQKYNHWYFEARNLIVDGYPNGKLPVVLIIGAEKANNISIYNSTNILFESTVGKKENINIIGCDNITIGRNSPGNKTQDVQLSYCNDITLNQASHATIIDCEHLVIGNLTDSEVLRSSYVNITNASYAKVAIVTGTEDNYKNVAVNLGFAYNNEEGGELVTVGSTAFFDKDDNLVTGPFLRNKRNPKTSTAAVVDEATGKTLDILLRETGTSGGGGLIKVIDFLPEWEDEQEHDIGMTWDEYVAVPKIIFRLDLGDGLCFTFEKIGMSSDGGGFSDLYLGRQRMLDVGNEWAEGRVVIQVSRKDGMAVVQVLDGTSVVLPAFSLGRQDKMINGLGNWVDFVPKADYDAKIAEIIERLNALEGK